QCSRWEDVGGVISRRFKLGGVASSVHGASELSDSLRNADENRATDDRVTDVHRAELGDRRNRPDIRRAEAMPGIDIQSDLSRTPSRRAERVECRWIVGVVRVA